MPSKAFLNLLARKKAVVVTPVPDVVTGSDGPGVDPRSWDFGERSFWRLGRQNYYSSKDNERKRHHDHWVSRSHHHQKKNKDAAVIVVLEDNNRVSKQGDVSKRDDDVELVKVSKFGKLSGGGEVLTSHVLVPHSEVSES